MYRYRLKNTSERAFGSSKALSLARANNEAWKLGCAL